MQALYSFLFEPFFLCAQADLLLALQFPLKLLSKARQKINPLLFGSGDLSILSKPSVGIVGSRDISENTIQYVHKAVEKFTDNSISIMSGGAKGVDLAAMNHALELGHCVIGVLPSELNKSLRDMETIRYISLIDKSNDISEFCRCDW